MRPTMIILHHSLTKDSGTVSAQAIRRYHKETLGWRDVGYHFLLELVGNEVEVFTGRPLDEAGAHTKGYNNSIGICCVGNYDVDDLPDAMFAKLVPLLRGLLRTLNIPLTNLRRHSEFAPKSCPGVRFPMMKVLAALKRELPL